MTLTQFAVWTGPRAFARYFWVRNWNQRKNACEVAERGYLLRNMGGSIRGATSGYSPYLQAWMLADGRVVSKLTWGTHTPHGLKTLLKKINGALAQAGGQPA
jgi:hypothetical protein